MSDKQARLFIPKYISGASVLASSIQVRGRGLTLHQPPSHLSEADYVIEAEPGGAIVVSKSIFDLSQTGLEWAGLDGLPREGYVVNWTEGEFSIGPEPYNPNCDNCPYLPALRADQAPPQEKRRREAQQAWPPPKWSTRLERSERDPRRGG